LAERRKKPFPAFSEEKTAKKKGRLQSGPQGRKTLAGRERKEAAAPDSVVTGSCTAEG